MPASAQNRRTLRPARSRITSPEQQLTLDGRAPDPVTDLKRALGASRAHDLAVDLREQDDDTLHALAANLRAAADDSIAGRLDRLNAEWAAAHGEAAQARLRLHDLECAARGAPRAERALWAARIRGARDAADHWIGQAEALTAEAEAIRQAAEPQLAQARSAADAALKALNKYRADRALWAALDSPERTPPTGLGPPPDESHARQLGPAPPSSRSSATRTPRAR